MSTHKIIVPAIAAALTLAAVIAIHPQTQIAHGALIVNTTISSTIIDSQGAAIAAGPLSCGIDTTLWCDVANN